MHRKAQVAVFLIVALIILAVVFLSGNITGKTFNFEQTSSMGNPQEEIKNYVESCLEQVGDEAIYATSLQGGYNEAPEQSIPVLNARIAHYWKNGKSLMPSKESFEQEISGYILENLPGCLDDFEAFRKQGYSLKMDDQIVKTTIVHDGVQFMLEAPITLIHAQTTYSINEFSATSSLNLEKAYAAASQIVLEQAKDPNFLPLSFIAGLAKEQGFEFELIYYNKNTLIISLAVPSQKEDLLLAFASEYDWNDIPALMEAP